MARKSASQSVDLNRVFNALCRVTPETLNTVFTASVLDNPAKTNRVYKMPASSHVVTLFKAPKGMPLSLGGKQVVGSGSLFVKVNVLRRTANSA